MAASTDRLSGTFWLLFLYDVCEEIGLEELRAILGAIEHHPAGCASTGWPRARWA